jgi:hypothetical protein
MNLRSPSHIPGEGAREKVRPHAVEIDLQFEAFQILQSVAGSLIVERYAKATVANYSV